MTPTVDTRPPSCPGSYTFQAATELVLPSPRPVDWQQVAYRLADECTELRRLLAIAEAPNLRGSLGWEPEPFVRHPGMLPVQERAT